MNIPALLLAHAFHLERVTETVLSHGGHGWTYKVEVLMLRDAAHELERLKAHNTALAAALATRTKQRDELVSDLAKLDDGERLRQFDHDTQSLPLNSNDPAA